MHARPLNCREPHTDKHIQHRHHQLRPQHRKVGRSRAWHFGQGNLKVAIELSAMGPTQAGEQCFTSYGLTNYTTHRMSDTK
jgi:hypothetical protein